MYKIAHTVSTILLSIVLKDPATVEFIRTISSLIHEEMSDYLW